MLKQKIMSIFEKIKSFEFDKNRNNIFGIKSGIVWGIQKLQILPLQSCTFQNPKALTKKNLKNC